MCRSRGPIRGNRSGPHAGRVIRAPLRLQKHARRGGPGGPSYAFGDPCGGGLRAPGVESESTRVAEGAGGGMLVHIIADYGHGDLAFAEVAQRIKLHLPDAELVLTPVPPFSTRAAGFCVAQLALNEAPAGTLVYHNVAPREDDEEARVENAGERLAFARLSTGVRVIGVNAGHAFSFLPE